MPHDHSHEHDHNDLFHSHAPAGKMKQAFFLALLILIVELVFGFLSNSLALLADAWHMATDTFSIALAWFALEQSKKAATKKMTFGYQRAGILAAAINGITLVVITFWILYSATHRMMHPEHTGGVGMLIGAGIGLAINLIIIFVLNGEGNNLNVKAALVHVIGDVGASAGVIIAAIIIFFTKWYIIDPILSVLIALIVAFSAWNIIKQCYRILMNATPSDIEVDEVASVIESVEGVQGIHDLHVWTLISGVNYLSCHVVLKENLKLSETHGIIEKINHALQHKNIQHTTIQLEDSTTTHENQLIYNHKYEENHHH